MEAYTCHTCSCKFGPNKFATFQWSQNCADISVQTSPRRHLRAASGRGRLFRGHGAHETLKIVLPDVLVSSHRIVAAMLLTGASCGMVMTIIPWVAGISEWMHFQLHARLLHAACQVYPPHPPPSQVYAMVYRFPVTCFLTWLLQSRMLVHTNIT